MNDKELATLTKVLNEQIARCEARIAENNPITVSFYHGRIDGLRQALGLVDMARTPVAETSDKGGVKETA